MLVSIILFVIMCIRVKYEKVSKAVSRSTGQNMKKDMQDGLYDALSEISPDLIPNNDGKRSMNRVLRNASNISYKIALDILLTNY